MNDLEKLILAAFIKSRQGSMSSGDREKLVLNRLGVFVASAEYGIAPHGPFVKWEGEV